MCFVSHTQKTYLPMMDWRKEAHLLPVSARRHQPKTPVLCVFPEVLDGLPVFPSGRWCVPSHQCLQGKAVWETSYVTFTNAKNCGLSSLVHLYLPCNHCLTLTSYNTCINHLLYVKGNSIFNEWQTCSQQQRNSLTHTGFLSLSRAWGHSLPHVTSLSLVTTQGHTSREGSILSGGHSTCISIKNCDSCSLTHINLTFQSS